MSGLENCPPDPGDGKEQSQTIPSQAQEVSAKPTVTPPEGGDSARAPKQMRTFQQILAEEKENRNILEIKLIKIKIMT